MNRVLFSRLHACPSRSLEGLLCAMSRVRVCVPVHSSAKQFHAAAEFKGRRHSHFQRNNFFKKFFALHIGALFQEKKEKKFASLIYSFGGVGGFVCFW